MAINFPSSPVQGQVYEFGDYVYTFDGVKWTSVLKYGLAAAKVSSETPPPNPEAGLMWYVPSTGESYLWYDDGDSGQWIQENPSIGAVAHRFLEGVNEPGSHEASAIRTATGISVQDYIGINDNYIALKIFQSPTDGGLTEIQTRTVDAGEVYEVRKTSDNSLATIYSDADGTTEIVQNGTANKSGSDGVVEFYIADGDYYVEVGGVRSNFKSVVSSLSVLFEDSSGEESSLQDLLDGLSTAKKIKSKRLEVTADDDFGTPDAAVTVARRHSRPNSGHGFKEFTEFDPTASDVAYAAYDSDFSTVGGNDFDIDHMVSYQSRLQHFSTGDLKYYSSVWALDRIEQGATCSNMFQFYDQGRTEGSTINHFSFVGNPLVNGTVQNYAGLRVNQPVGNVGGEIQNTLTGVYIEDLSFEGGASTYPIFIETQTNEASIGCYWRFKNRLIMEGVTIFKVSPTPDFDATRDLGGSNLRWKQFYAVTNNSTLLNLEPQNTEPTKIAGKTIAMSDGTASTNSFGTSGEGLYRCNSAGTWVFVG